MRHINGLVESLNKQLGWNKARVGCFAKMLVALIAVKTVNLQELATGFPSGARLSSRYRRLQKFFALFEIDFVVIARWLFSLFFAGQDKYYIVIDRTNWYWGKRKVNIFMLSIAYEGQAIPIFWRLLNKAGNSNFAEQRALITGFIEQFGTQGIAGLLADREFASGSFFQWLNQRGIPFYIRIKGGSQVYIKRKRFKAAERLFSHLNPQRQMVFNMSVNLWNVKLFLSGARSERGELMIVATNSQPKTAIACYLRRWEIENLFQGLKGRGFRFEDTHITHPERIAKLLALVAIGFAWAHKVGEWQALQRPILTKKFRLFQTPQQTFFRYGLDFIRDAILHSADKMKQRRLKQCIQFLNPLIPNSASNQCNSMKMVV